MEKTDFGHFKKKCVITKENTSACDCMYRIMKHCEAAELFQNMAQLKV